MARQALNMRKTATLAARTGLDVVKILVRGGTDHRKDLLLADGSIMCLYSDGTIEPSSIGWYKTVCWITLRKF